MNIYKMYYLEKSVQLLKKDFNNSSELLTAICKKANIQKPTVEVINYIKGALAISYSEAVEILRYCHNNQMPEHLHLRFIEELSKEYNVSKDIVISRINSVDKLSNSILFSKKIGDLYSTHNKEHSQKMA